MEDNYFIDPSCEVNITLRKKCFNVKEGLFEFRFRQKTILVPHREVKFLLQYASDLSSLWTIMLDITQIKSIRIECYNVTDPNQYNNEYLG